MSAWVVDDGSKRAGCSGVSTGHGVAVPIQRRGDSAVIEATRHHSERNPSGDHLGGHDVAKIVESEPA